MIQRQQTLWLILSTVCAFLTFKFPFVTGKEIITNGTPPADVVVDAGSNFFLLIFTAASIILSTVCIFFFKDRKLQMKLCVVGIILSVAIIAVYVMQVFKLQDSTLALYCILPLGIFIGYIMAHRGIRRDEKLIKSLDKLR